MTNRYVRAGVAGLVVGAVALGSALAGVVVRPLPPDAGTPDAAEVLRAAGLERRAAADADHELGPADVASHLRADVKAPSGARTPDGTFLAGASRVSIAPDPARFGGERWMTEGCTSLEDQNLNVDHALPPVDPADPVATVDEIRGWPASSPDCVYLGGFGIGPARAAERVGQGGVWIRALAISNGEQTFVYAVGDLVGWFARYDATICVDCGIRDVRDRLASELGLPVGDIAIGSTHSHATADTYGGWGGIPRWYRNQIRDSAIAAVKAAVASLEPATLASGEVHLRDRNQERRDTYYSTVDTAATWLQARSIPEEPQPCDRSTAARRKKRPRRTARPAPTRAPRPTPCVTTPEPAHVIATMATYAAHPVIVDDAILHADWPGATARRFESVYGGVGLTFEGGLGNASPREAEGASDEEKAEGTGRAIADEVVAAIARGGGKIATSEMRASVGDITHPVTTNAGLVTMAAVGLFDREFIPVSPGGGTPGAGVPGAYHWSKAGEASTSGDASIAPEPGALRGCDSAGPTIVTTVGAHRIGDTLIAFAPGEIFSNIAEVVKERADANRVAVVLGQMNDALGYIIQSFEFDASGNAVTEYGTRTGEYEEVFALDRCIGDHVLESMLEATNALGFGR